jgi:hypothetical protein
MSHKQNRKLKLKIKKTLQTILCDTNIQFDLDSGQMCSADSKLGPIPHKKIFLKLFDLLCSFSWYLSVLCKRFCYFVLLLCVFDSSIFFSDLFSSTEARSVFVFK